MGHECLFQREVQRGQVPDSTLTFVLAPKDVECGALYMRTRCFDSLAAALMDCEDRVANCCRADQLRDARGTVPRFSFFFLLQQVLGKRLNSRNIFVARKEAAAKQN